MLALKNPCRNLATGWLLTSPVNQPMRSGLLGADRRAFNLSIYEGLSAIGVIVDRAVQ